MPKVIQANLDEHQDLVRRLFREHLNDLLVLEAREFGSTFDVEAVLGEDMQTLDQFAPPQGRLLLAECDGLIVGVGGLRRIGPYGEIKRLYVRPDFRGRGIGRAIMQALLEEAARIGYPKVRFNVAPFSRAAHTLYRSLGFEQIEPYEESEVPDHLRHAWIFMEKCLGSGGSTG